MRTIKLLCYFFVLFTTLLKSGCANTPTYGVQDNDTEKQINRINKIIDLRETSHDYDALEKYLLENLVAFSDDKYAKPRILFELADIYSYQLLDIEKAIKLDEELLKQTIEDIDTKKGYAPTYKVANETILGENPYIENYVKIKKENIVKIVKKRLSKNKKLLKGDRTLSYKYSLSDLKSHISTVRNDLSKQSISNIDRKMLISRLIKAEYEIKKLSPTFEYDAYSYLMNGGLSNKDVDLREIDFLSLSDYLIGTYKQTNNINFAESALNVIYLPYSNLKKSEYRWRYNSIVNEYISILIDANYAKKNYEDMLYYISLNKSRMILEEQLSINDNEDGFIKSLFFSTKVEKKNNQNYPTKQFFRQKLSSIDNYLDFYINGTYSKKKVTFSSLGGAFKSQRTIRDFSIKSNDAYRDGFTESFALATYIRRGKIFAVEKISEKKLKKLKQQVNSSLRDIVSHKKDVQPSPILRELSYNFSLPSFTKVSPDKWLARHPLTFHLNTNVVRSVNIIMNSEDTYVNDINVLGFFNPTLDLTGAEEEAEAIQEHIPNAQLFMRENATLNRLNTEKNFNIIHLSMHGKFNAQQPQFSKLFFAGSKPGEATNDPNALYARDMNNLPSLRNKKLIFAAACETGIISADKNNESELMGILRPLTASHNKNIILSLWKVDDEATKDFVSVFYSQLEKKHNILESFIFSQNKIRSAYPHPYYWAAFYLSQSN
ncbi:MAG: CHAT domain-containing protein [Candidatus Electrothrix sp. Rat3]|nr:CHAT domain-containing protein [Candidatus Electrothrix rattekaaiensis]